MSRKDKGDALIAPRQMKSAEYERRDGARSRDANPLIRAACGSNFKVKIDFKRRRVITLETGNCTRAPT